MKTVLDTSDRPAHDALVEKKSEFIADVCHVDALDEALLFVDSVRQLHPRPACGVRRDMRRRRWSRAGEDER